MAKGLIVPDRRFDRVSSIQVKADLVAKGFTHVLLDMDNTVLSRATHDVPFDVERWVAQAKEGGVAVCLVSNSWHDGPSEVGRRLGVPVVARAMKPLPHAFLAARGKIGARSADTVVVGDQPSTDVLGAHLLGMKAYLVQPLAADHEPERTRLLRRLEEALMGASAGAEGAFDATGQAARKAKDAVAGGRGRGRAQEAAQTAGEGSERVG